MQLELAMPTGNPDKQVLRNAKAIIEADHSIWTIQAITDATDTYCTDHNLINPRWEYYDKRAQRIRADISKPSADRLANVMNVPKATDNKKVWAFMRAVETYDKTHSVNERLALIDKAINI